MCIRLKNYKYADNGCTNYKLFICEMGRCFIVIPGMGVAEPFPSFLGQREQESCQAVKPWSLDWNPVLVVDLEFHNVVAT